MVFLAIDLSTSQRKKTKKKRKKKLTPYEGVHDVTMGSARSAVCGDAISRFTRLRIGPTRPQQRHGALENAGLKPETNSYHEKKATNSTLDESFPRTIFSATVDTEA